MCTHFSYESHHQDISGHHCVEGQYTSKWDKGSAEISIRVRNDNLEWGDHWLLVGW